MEHDRISDAPSTAAIGEHPIHPMLIPFPIAFLTGALAADVVYWAMANLFWPQAAFWLLLAGLVTGVLAAVFGFIDFVSIRRAHSLAAGWVHFLGNAVALGLTGANVYLRWQDPVAPVLPWGLVLSAVVAGILVVTGWLGGELSYRYKIGVSGVRPEQVGSSAAVQPAQQPMV